MKAILFLVCMLLISSCMTEEKAVKFLKDKRALARTCAAEYPVTVKPGLPFYVRDTIIEQGDSIPCPPVLNTISGKRDTFYIKCPPRQIITNTEFVHDTILPTALLTAKDITIDSLKQALTIESTLKNKLKEDVVKHAKISGLLGLIGVIFLIIIIILFRR